MATGRKKQEAKHEIWELRQMQSLPLDIKVKMTQRRIMDWYNYWGGEVYVSFSGGKDSTVLLHIARELFPDIPAVFVNTGLEYPEIREFAKSFENVAVVYPEMSFDKVIISFGYPVLGKEISHKLEYARKGADWALKFVNGEALDEHGKKSRYNISKYKPILDMDFKVSSACIFCGFGCHLERESRFLRLKQTHPRQYEYCIGGEYDADGLWKPNKTGLGMGHVFDVLNKVYGEGFIKYK